jgi:periplasmic protein TonB
MTYTSSDTAKQPSLFVGLAHEVNHRSLIGLLAIVVVLLHGMTVLWLLQPTKTVNETKPLKLMEVLLLPKPEVKIKPEPKPKPKPEVKLKVVQPATPKKMPPKLKAGKPPIKEKAPVATQPPVEKQAPKLKPVVHKAIEHAKPQPSVHKIEQLPKISPVLSSKSATRPAPPVFSSAYNKPSASAPAPTSSASTAKFSTKKPAEKFGNSGSDNNTVSSGVVELSQAKPSYPMRAKSRNIEGWAKVEFTVTASGAVANAHVVGSSPPGVFDSSALDAIMKFRFKPKMVNGKAVNGSATKKFNFTLN